MSVDATTLIVAVIAASVTTLLLTLAYLRFAGHRSLREKPAIPAVDEQLRTVLGNIAEGVMIVDPQGTISMFNPMAEQIFGYKENEIRGKNVDALLTDIRTGAGGAIGSGTREAVGLRKSGATFQVDLTVCETGDKGHPGFRSLSRATSPNANRPNSAWFISRNTTP